MGRESHTGRAVRDHRKERLLMRQLPHQADDCLGSSCVTELFSGSMSWYDSYTGMVGEFVSSIVPKCRFGEWAKRFRLLVPRMNRT